MYFILLIAWFVFNGRITLEVTLFGLVICSAIYWFLCRFVSADYMKEDWRRLRAGFAFLKYLAVLFVEIVKANFVVMDIILTPGKIENEPVLVKVDTSFKNWTLDVWLANSITLTPGTITVKYDHNHMIVHALDRTLSEGMEDGVFAKQLHAIEEKYYD